MTNQEFDQLNEEEKAAFFSSVEDPDTLTKSQKAEYDEWAEAQDEEPADPSVSEKAAAYFKNHPDIPYKSLLVVSDGSIFYPTLKGRNLCENHVRLNEAKGLTVEEVNK